MDKKKSLTVDTGVVDPSDVPEEIKASVKGYFPVYFSEDEEERVEEVKTRN
jgi:hypothetical protein